MDLGVVHIVSLIKSKSRIKSKRTALNSTEFQETGDIGILTRRPAADEIEARDCALTPRRDVGAAEWSAACLVWNRPGYSRQPC